MYEDDFRYTWEYHEKYYEENDGEEEVSSRT